MLRHHWIRGFGVSLAAVGLGVACFFFSGSPSTTSASPLSGAGVLAQERAQEASIPDVAERVSPAVVSVYTSRPAPVMRNLDPELAPLIPRFGVPFGDGQRPQTEQSLGSGVIVAPDGVILTNNHVVDHAQDIRVVLNDRREFVARILGRDPKTDIAVLRIDAKGLTVLPFGDSAKMRIGETVLAVGNPLGVGQTVSKGIISAKGRGNVGITDYEDFLQTDAAINPGNSGGALVSLRGELIGLNSAIATRTGGFQGIGFAIPSNLVRQVMDLLLKNGKVSRGQMGVLVQDLTPQLAAAFADAPKEGVLIGDVIKQSPADKAGLKRGDIILKLDGEPVHSASELRNRVSLRGAGQEVRLTLWRNKDTQEITLKLRQEPREEKADQEGDEEESNARAERGSASGVKGLRVSPATPSLLRKAGLPQDLHGLVVVSVEAPAAFAGLKDGDLVVEVNRKPVESVQEFRRAVREGTDNVLLSVRRGPGLLYLVGSKDPAGMRDPAPKSGENY